MTSGTLTLRDWSVVVPQDGGKAGKPKRGYQPSAGAGIDADIDGIEWLDPLTVSG